MFATFFPQIQSEADYRSTTEPPTLDAKHPLRRAFTRYGNQAARHPIITLLISISIATILIYPFPFLYTNDFANGSSNLPHHVWTSAEPFHGDQNTTPDVVMRSIWVHGIYETSITKWLADIDQAATCKRCNRMFYRQRWEYKTSY